MRRRAGFRSWLRSSRRSPGRRRRCAPRTRSLAIRRQRSRKPRTPWTARKPQGRRNMTTVEPAGLFEAAELVRTGKLSAVDLTEACLARADAARAHKEIASGKYRGALHGVPVSVKDLVDVAGTPTTSASRVPARRPLHDAPVVGMLRRAGAVIVGKTNLHEFAFGTTGDETAFGAIRNPIDRSRSAGGSSSGAAVALVERMCYGSVGTDTGGSIRIPAAACGVTGLKPTSGEISVDGVVPLSTTLDHVGPLAGSVTDTALLYYAMLDGDARLDRVPQPAPDPLWL